MDEHGLPIVGSGVDYTKVPSLDHRNTLAMLNKFIVQTTKFLNRFSSVSEERLSDLSGRIQRLDISLSILESKLSSIPSLEGVQASSQYEPPAAVASAGSSSGGQSQQQQQAAPVSTGPAPPPPPGEPAPPPQPVAAEPQQQNVVKIKDDPLYKQFFKMKRLGVNPLQIAMIMSRQGLNPDLLEDEDAPAPGKGAGSSSVPDAAYRKPGSNSSDESDESSNVSDESFDSD